MTIMKKISTLFLTVILIFSLSISAFATESLFLSSAVPFAIHISANEDTEYFRIPLSNTNDGNAETFGFFYLDVSLTGNKSSRTVSATVKNTAALGFSTIDVAITLYSSRTGSPVVRASKSDNDLNLGESLTVSHTNVSESAKYYAVVSGIANGEKLYYSTYKIPFNQKAEKYPTQISSPVTGQSLPYNFAMTLKKIPEEDRVVWNSTTKKQYANRLGVDLTDYDVHHIIPRAYGGTNADSNLIPLNSSDHTTVTSWWANY